MNQMLSIQLESKTGQVTDHWILDDGLGMQYNRREKREIRKENVIVN